MSTLFPRSTSHMSSGPSPQPQSSFSSEAPNPTALNLTRLLSRLEHTILSQEGSARLRHSPYERTKVGANLEHARTLLLSLEHSSASPATKSTSSSQSNLVAQRRLLKTLQTRLYELSDTGPGAASEDEDDDDEEDLLARYAPARKNTHDSIDYDKGNAGATLTPGQKAAAAAAAGAITSELRARGGQTSSQQNPSRGVASGTDSHPSATGTKTNSTSPFAPSKSTSEKQSGTDKSTTQLMEAHESEQGALTESLVSLARALKESTLSFSDAVTDSNPLVDAAGKALEKNVLGMESAGERMGKLRKLSSGRSWWWDRLGLYAQIGVLWVAIILIMAALPKLRF